MGSLRTARIRIRGVAMLAAFVAGIIAAPGAEPDQPDEPKPIPESPPPGEIRFEGKSSLRGVKGVFNRWCIRKAEIDREAPENSSLELEIDVASLETNDEDRNASLREEEFFHVEKYPRARITIDSVRALADRTPEGTWYKARIEIVLRGVSRAQDVEFKLHDDDPVELSGRLEIRRTDFGVGKPYRWYNPMSVRDEIPVSFRLEIGPEVVAAADAPAPAEQSESAGGGN